MSGIDETIVRYKVEVEGVKKAQQEYDTVNKELKDTSKIVGQLKTQLADFTNKQDNFSKKYSAIANNATREVELLAKVQRTRFQLMSKESQLNNLLKQRTIALNELNSAKKTLKTTTDILSVKKAINNELGRANALNIRANALAKTKLIREKQLAISEKYGKHKAFADTLPSGVYLNSIFKINNLLKEQRKINDEINSKEFKRQERLKKIREIRERTIKKHEEEIKLQKEKIALHNKIAKQIIADERAQERINTSIRKRNELNKSRFTSLRGNQNAYKGMDTLPLVGGRITEQLPNMVNAFSKFSGFADVTTSMERIRKLSKEIGKQETFKKAKRDAHLFVNELYKVGKIGTKEFNRLNKAIDKSRLDTRRLGRTLAGTMTRLGAVGTKARALFVNLTRFYIAFQSGKMLLEFVASAEKLKQSLTELQSTAGSDDIIKQMERLSEVTGGLANKYAMIPAINKAIDLGVDMTNGKLLKTARMVSVIARKYGIDYKKAFSDFTVAIGKATPLVLDNVGVLLKLEEAYKEHYNTLYKGKKTYNEWIKTLKQSEKRAIYMEQAMKKLEERTATFPLYASPMQTALTKLEERFDKFKLTISNNQVFKALIWGLNKTIDYLNLVSDGFTSVMGLYKAFQREVLHQKVAMPTDIDYFAEKDFSYYQAGEKKKRIEMFKILSVLDKIEELKKTRIKRGLSDSEDALLKEIAQTHKFLKRKEKLYDDTNKKIAEYEKQASSGEGISKANLDKLNALKLLKENTKEIINVAQSDLDDLKNKAYETTNIINTSLTLAKDIKNLKNDPAFNVHFKEGYQEKLRANYAKTAKDYFKSSDYMSNRAKALNNELAKLDKRRKDLIGAGYSITPEQMSEIKKTYGELFDTVSLSIANYTRNATHFGKAADIMYSGSIQAKDGFVEEVKGLNQLGLAFGNIDKVTKTLDKNGVVSGNALRKQLDSNTLKEFNETQKQLTEGNNRLGNTFKHSNTVLRALYVLAKKTKMPLNEMVDAFNNYSVATVKAFENKSKGQSFLLWLKGLESIKKHTKTIKQLGDQWYKLNRGVYETRLSEIPLVKKIENIRGQMHDLLEQGRKLRKEFSWKISYNEFKAFEKQVIDVYQQKIDKLIKTAENAKSKIFEALDNRNRERDKSFTESLITEPKKEWENYNNWKLKAVRNNSEKLNKIRQEEALKGLKQERETALKGVDEYIGIQKAKALSDLKQELKNEKDLSRKRKLASEMYKKSVELELIYGTKAKAMKTEVNRKFDEEKKKVIETANSYKEYWDYVKKINDLHNDGVKSQSQIISDSTMNKINAYKEALKSIKNDNDEFLYFNNASQSASKIGVWDLLIGKVNDYKTATKDTLIATRLLLNNVTQGTGLEKFSKVLGKFNNGFKFTVDKEKFMKIAQSLDYPISQAQKLYDLFVKIGNKVGGIGKGINNKIKDSMDNTIDTIKNAYTSLAREVGDKLINEAWTRAFETRATNKDKKAQLDADKQALRDARSQDLLSKEQYTKRMQDLDTKYLNEKARQEKLANRQLLMGLGQMAYAKGAMLMIEGGVKMFSNPVEGGAMVAGGGALIALGATLGYIASNMTLPPTTPSAVGESAKNCDNKQNIIIHNDVFENRLDFGRTVSSYGG